MTPDPDEHDGTIAEQTVLAGQYEIIRKLGEGGMSEVHPSKESTDRPCSCAALINAVADHFAARTAVSALSRSVGK